MSGPTNTTEKQDDHLAYAPNGRATLTTNEVPA